jgi:hypothetical protein
MNRVSLSGTISVDRLWQTTDILAAGVFPYLNLCDHMSMSHTSWLAYNTSTLPVTWCKTIRFSGNNVNLGKLASLATLISLRIWNSTVTDAGILYLQDTLKELDLDSSFITDLSLRHFSKFKLVSLQLRRCRGVSDLGLFWLRGLPLTRLQLFDCPSVMGPGLSHLVRLPCTHLTIGGQHMRRIGIGLSHLAHLPLRHLVLCRCRFLSDLHLVHLANLPLLCLEIRRCIQITDVGIATLSSLGLLRELTLRHCPSITGDCVRHFPRLERLCLSNSAVTDATLIHVRDLPLVRLELSDTVITNVGLSYLSQLPLNCLLVSGTHITDLGLSHLSRLPLHELHLGRTSITDVGLSHVRRLPLHRLHVNRTLITGSGLVHLDQLPLTCLDLRDNSITDVDLIHLRRLPLQELWVNVADVNLRGIFSFQRRVSPRTMLSQTSVTRMGLYQLDNRSSTLRVLCCSSSSSTK